MTRRPPAPLTLAAGLVAGAMVMAGCAGGGSSDAVATTDSTSSASASTTTLSLFAYAVPKPGYDKVVPAFQKTASGAGVEFQQSYGASGDQSRKVAAGAEADVVNFSVEPDIPRLVDAGLVDTSWNSGPEKGIPFGSVVTLVVRKGNPKGINTWDDLLKDGVDVVTPNPFSSGSAKWNLLAPYAVKSNGGVNQQAGLDYLDQLITQHVHVQPKSGREATETFLQGTGDVLLSYENEALFAERAGEEVEHVTPSETFKIENPVAVIKSSKNAAAAQAFVDYLYTPEAQELWAEAGFRPVNADVLAKHAADFPTPQKLWTITDLGGWKAVDKDLFTKDTGKIAVIYAKATS